MAKHKLPSTWKDGQHREIHTQSALHYQNEEQKPGQELLSGVNIISRYRLSKSQEIHLNRVKTMQDKPTANITVKS